MEARRFPNYLHQTLAAQVKNRRIQDELSQEELAVKTGLHRTYIGAIERAERNVSLATLEALAAGLECDPGDLLGPSRGS